MDIGISLSLRLIIDQLDNLFLTVNSSSDTPAFRVFSLSTGIFSARKMRCSREKMSGASGLDWIRAMSPPSQEAWLKWWA